MKKESSQLASQTLAVLVSHVWNDRAWLESELTAHREVPAMTDKVNFEQMFPELGLSNEALTNAWELYTQFAMSSSQLTPNRGEDLFLFGLLGLHKARRKDKTLWSPLVWTFALDYGKDIAHRLVQENANS